jgi:Uma2 family endonuclease
MATKTKLFTYDDYLNLPKDSFKYEVLGGALIERQSPPTIHQRVSGNLLISLINYIRKNNLGEIVGRIDVVLSMTNIVQPDLLFVSKERQQIIAEKNIVAAPDLVVEIIDESTKNTDQTTKKTLYEKYGVKEYWIVYPNEEKVEQFLLENEKLILNNTLQQTEKLSSRAIGGLTLSADQIFSQ